MFELGVFCFLAIAGVIWYVYRRRNRSQEDLPPPPVDWLVELDKVEFREIRIDISNPHLLDIN